MKNFGNCQKHVYVGKIRIPFKCTMYIQISAVLRILRPYFSCPLKELTKYPLLLGRMSVEKCVRLHSKNILFLSFFIHKFKNFSFFQILF